MFDRILNVALRNNLVQLKGSLWKSLPPLGSHKGILDSPNLLILVIHTEHKNNKTKSSTDPTISFL